MKKFSSIFSAFIFLFGAAGYHLFFTLADEKVKGEMEEIIHAVASTEQVIQFTFSNEELQKDVHFTHRKEFIYYGEHYDVISSHKDGNNIIFRCVNDERETSLFTWFRKNLDHHNAGNSDGKISFKPFAADWLMPNDPFLSVKFSALIFSAETTFIPNTVHAEIPTPPPNSCA